MVLLVGHFARHIFYVSDEPAAADVRHHSGPHERALRKRGNVGLALRWRRPELGKCGGSEIEGAWRLARLPKCDLTDQCADEKSPIADLNQWWSLILGRPDFPGGITANVSQGDARQGFTRPLVARL